MNINEKYRIDGYFSLVYYIKIYFIFHLKIFWLPLQTPFAAQLFEDYVAHAKIIFYYFMIMILGSTPKKTAFVAEVLADIAILCKFLFYRYKYICF